jgi:hypothetical protein
LYKGIQFPLAAMATRSTYRADWQDLDWISSLDIALTSSFFSSCVSFY